jgi:hypothetical protein
MNISIRSRVLIYIGRLIYGDPRGFGLDCSAEEFYALQNERPVINPRNFHPQKVSSWQVMRRNLLIDQIRIKVFKHMAISATVAAAAIFFSGSLLITGIVKGKQTVSEIRAKSKAEDAKEEQANTSNKQQKIQARALEIVEELKALQAQANEGKVDKQTFEKKQTQLVEEYKKLEGAL